MSSNNYIRVNWNWISYVLEAFIQSTAIEGRNWNTFWWLKIYEGRFQIQVLTLFFTTFIMNYLSYAANNETFTDGGYWFEHVVYSALQNQVPCSTLIASHKQKTDRHVPSRCILFPTSVQKLCHVHRGHSLFWQANKWVRFRHRHLFHQKS